MEDDWVKTAEWPFLAISSSTTAAVVPFDEPDQDGFMPDLVMIIPRGFFTASLIIDLDVELDDHFFGGGQFLWKQYRDAVHFKLGQLETTSLINIVTLMLKTKTPAIFTLALAQIELPILPNT